MFPCTRRDLPLGVIHNTTQHKTKQNKTKEESIQLRKLLLVSKKSKNQFSCKTRMWQFTCPENSKATDRNQCNVVQVR